MLNDITIGRYIHADTVLHRLAPWIKIVLTLIYATSVLLLSSPVSYMIYILFTTLLVKISKVTLKKIVKGLKPLIWLLVFTAIFNIFLIPGKVLFEIFSFTATYEGVYEAIRLSLKLILLVIGTSLLTLTTKPIAITDGIEKILKPLDKIHFPSHELAMMMSIALRFIPTIADETDRIMKAQRSRGADMENGNILKRAKMITSAVIPLLTSAFKRAEELAVAMDARCYNGKNRTRMREVRASGTDAFAALVMIIVSAVTVIL